MINKYLKIVLPALLWGLILSSCSPSKSNSPSAKKKQNTLQTLKEKAETTTNYKSTLQELEAQLYRVQGSAKRDSLKKWIDSLKKATQNSPVKSS